MRSRVTILCGVILLSIVAPRPAAASGWGAFVAWLSELDPWSVGIGVEIPIKPLCSPLDPCTAQVHDPKPVFKTSAAVLVGSVEGQVGKMYVLPAAAILEWRLAEHFYGGGGGGYLQVGGIPGGVVKQGFTQLRVTAIIKGVGVRFEYNQLYKGFKENAFGNGKPATGKEPVFGLSVGWIH